MKRFRENKVEQGYKKIKWYIKLDGTIPAQELPQSGYLKWVWESICENIADSLGTSADELNGGLFIHYQDDIEATLVVVGWDDLSFNAQSVIIYELIDAMENHETWGEFTVADFFDEEDLHYRIGILD